MSTSTPSDSVSHTHGPSRKRKKSEEAEVQRKKPSTAMLGQSIDQRFTDDVQVTVDRIAGDEESLLINYEGKDAESTEIKDGADPVIKTSTKDLTIAIDTTSISMFPGASNFQVNNSDIITVGRDAMFIRLEERPFTEVQRDLISDYIAKHIVLPAINENSQKHVLTQLIILLPRAEAVFNDYQTKKKSGPCLEGTRVALLKEMADWVTSQDESRMYILSGLAGIGKSTVAYTIASRAADLNLLGASFFFSRDEADRSNAKKLFTTIAYQLCVYEKRFADAIGDALQTVRGSAAVTKDPLEQLRALILHPLLTIVQSRVRPILVIVDALDECCEADVRGVIQGLGQLVRNLPSFKVILTTRPHPYINYFLDNQDGHKLFCLQDIADKIVDSDIRLYLKYNLSPEKVREHFPKRQLCVSDEQMDSLVHAAGRLFVIAATSVRYILDNSAYNPEARIQKLLHAYARDHTPFKDLDQFYTVILRNVVPEGCDDDDIVSRYQSVVGAIILARHPVSVSTLAHLIGTDEEEIRAVLDNLQSVILLGDDDVPRVYHKSFPDYLTDKVRCKDYHLQIDLNIHHTRIAICCLEIADRHLKYNILGLGTPARFMSNEDGIKMDGMTEEQLEEKIPQHLRYACVYWVAHLELATIDDSDIMRRLDKFVNKHMLHWFEVLSLIGKLDLAHRTIRIVLNLSVLSSSSWYRLLSDALRFISKFYEVINQSALHLYYSALPFSPTDSLLYHQYIKDTEYGICDIEGGPQKWDTLVADLNRGELVGFVKFSANSALLASYRPNYTCISESKLNILDAVTGTPISTISGRKFATSNDFSMIASSKDNIITCYDLEGATTGNMLITASEIKALTLSCENNPVAAGLSDGTVCLWKSLRGKLIDTFDEYDPSDYQTHFRFSPSGIQLVYSSTNGIIKLRDGTSGRLMADLQCGSRNKLEFSANGSRIASLSADCGLKLWNSESGGLIGVVTGVGSKELAISANGSLLATADKYNVTLWSETCDQLIEIKLLECQQASSMAFSPDNKLVISDTSTLKVYNIETDTISTFLPRGSFGPVAFSPDGTRLACGTLLCDTQAVDTSSSPSITSLPFAIALSRDCLRLACGFSDGTVELWGTSPMMQCIASHRVSGLGPMGMSFVPDGRLFASWSSDQTIKLWNGRDGSLLGTLNVSTELSTVALSNGMLIAAGSKKVTLWDPDTLSLLHTFTVDLVAHKASISDKGDLAAIIFNDESVHLLDFENQTTTSIHTSSLCGLNIRSLTFLPDKSHLVARFYNDEFQSLNLVNKHITTGPMLERLIQLPDTPLWHGVPIWVRNVNRQYCVMGLFSQDQSPVPVLWIPTDISLGIHVWTEGSSVIAFGWEGGRKVILLRLRTSHAD